MKKLAITLTLVLVLAGGSLSLMPSTSQAQVFVPVQPVQTVAAPWVGTNTPWVYYNGDWFMNGILYYFFGNNRGWAPYYAYAPTYIVRPNYWYAPRWHNWYQTHPTYWRNFQHRYPYWHGHKPGQHYNQAFYNRYHHGQGGGWHKGLQAGPHKSVPPAGRKPYPANVGQGHGPQHPGQPGHFQPGPTPQGRQGHQGHYQPNPSQHGQKGHYQPGQPAPGHQKPQRENPQHPRPQE